MIILIPFICTYDHKMIKSYEIGILLASATAGELIASRFTEPAISKIGTKWSIQLGFMFMAVASFAFWAVSYTPNDSDFMSFAFLSRFLYGFGSGLLRSVIIIARAQSKKGKQSQQARDYLKWHLKGEAFGYFFGPLLMVVTNHSKWENERTAMWLAIVTTITWFLFTVCFVDTMSSAQVTRDAIQAAENNTHGPAARNNQSRSPLSVSSHY